MKLTRREINTALAMQAPAGHPLRELMPKPQQPRKPRQKPEEALQEMLCQWLDTQPRILYWANNPQIITGKLTGAKIGYLAKLKKRGFKKGIPDICLLFLNRKGVSTFCFAELKSLSGTATEEQTYVMIAAEERGAFTGIVKSLGDLQELLDRAGY